MFGGFPFGGMPGGMGGGFPGMDTGGRGGPVNNSRYYEVLGVSKECTAADIKKAHRKLALKLHPDKPGGDQDKFKEINEAYEVLKDPETRQLYDQHGEEFIKEGGASAGGGGGGMSDLFDMLNGGGGRSRGPRGPRKSDDISQKLHVSLKDFYLGTTKKLLMKRPLKCEACDGTGSKNKVKSTCQPCQGTGVETVVRQIGPGMMTQMQRPCSQCRGKGSTRKPGEECRVCKGEGIVEDQKKFEVVLEKGAPDGHKITLRGEAGVSEPGMLPGDVNFVFVQNKGEDDDWRRQGADLLVMDFPISLKQALCASELHLRHLDGRVVNMQREPGLPLKPGEWIRVQDEGMPVFNRPYSKGNLYVRITVVMPSSLSPEALAKVGALLPDDGECTPMDADEADDVKMTDVGPGERLQEELQMRMRAYRQQMSAYDSDEDEGPGQQRVQCAQQ